MDKVSTLAQSHDGTRWHLSEDGMFARPESSRAEEDWRPINEVRMEKGILWPVREEEPNG